MTVGNALLEQVIAIAIKAGKSILEIYEQQIPLDIKKKPDNSPVTQADLLAHQIIVEGLSTLTPDIPILSEEDPDFSFATRSGWNYFWLVDPLDGTREFINKSGQFTVNIALIKGGTPIMGVIYVPRKTRVYFALKEFGAFKMDEEKIPKQLVVRSWQQGEEIILVTTRKELQEALQLALSAISQVRITYRSSSLKFCLLAEGRADIYLRNKPIHEWDTAAGQCILEEAGGIVLGSNWQPLRYNTQPHLLNPPFIALGDSKQLLSHLQKMPIFCNSSGHRP
jgi:3'(2'), 5'-bisphosphate nucleotidase